MVQRKKDRVDRGSYIETFQDVQITEIRHDGSRCFFFNNGSTKIEYLPVEKVDDKPTLRYLSDFIIPRIF